MKTVIKLIIIIHLAYFNQPPQMCCLLYCSLAGSVITPKSLMTKEQPQQAVSAVSIYVKCELNIQKKSQRALLLTTTLTPVSSWEHPPPRPHHCSSDIFTVQRLGSSPLHTHTNTLTETEKEWLI